MGFEQLFSIKKIKDHPEYPLYIGVLYTLLAFFGSWFLFKNVTQFIGVSTILLLVILTIPIVTKLFKYEEKILQSKKKFWKKHKTITNFFLYYFIGLFITFFILSMLFPTLVFTEAQLYGQTAVEPPVQFEGKVPPPPPTVGPQEFSIFRNNIFVFVLVFLLSLFYGSGALFLITLNASIFASALAKVVRANLPAGLNFIHKTSFLTCNLGTMFLHMIPEVGAYLLAAIAGGVLSEAVAHEKLFSQKFNKVLWNTIALALSGVVILLIAAVVEANISQGIFRNNVCGTNTTIVLGLIGLIIIVTVFEMIRRKHH